VRHPDGAIRYIQANGLVLRDGAGNPVRMLGVNIDLTERKLAELAFSRSQHELQAIYDSSPIMMCLVNRQGKVEQMNRTMLEFVGGVTSPDGQRFPGDLLGCVNALDDPRGCNFGTQCKTCPLRLAMAQTFETGQPCGQVEAELFLVRSGVRREVRVSASTGLVRLADQPRALVCLEDVTNRKLLEEQLRQSQKLESVGQLAGGVAHDFNNILAAVMMQLSLLQRNSSLDQDTRESIKELMTEAKRGASLTRQLLMFSRRSVLEVKVLDLTELVTNMLKMLGRLIGEQVTIRFDRREGLPPVEADPGMIEQVLMNLAVNARDAMPKGGDLTIKIEAVQVDPQRIQKFAETRPGLFVCLSMRDTGCGMDAHTLQKVFEPFFTTKEPGKGTGLGLATVHGIVAQHKGWVEVESEPGKGSLFRVFLPSTPSISLQPMEIPDQPTAFGHETILVVEDEASVRNGLLRNLEHLGYRVFAAANGREAMKVWQEHSAQVDLLLSDMVMPEGMTGLDLAEKMRLEKPALRVIISSGYNLELVGHGTLEAEGVVYLGKPYDIEALSKTIQGCLDQK
jgi:signal transduction histidine kinase/ActR/RegA family two-component response regulator